MTIFERLNLLERVHHLISRKATGSPEQLAQKNGYSKRQTLRLIGDLKALGMPIRYDRERCTYYYSEQVDFKVQVLIETEQEKNIKGGKNLFFIPSAIFWHRARLSLNPKTFSKGILRTLGMRRLF